MANSQKHPFETNPPRQQKFVVNDDNWEIPVTGKPVGHSNISSNANDVMANSIASTTEMLPVYSDKGSFAIHDSHTSGRKK